MKHKKKIKKYSLDKILHRPRINERVNKLKYFSIYVYVRVVRLFQYAISVKIAQNLLIKNQVVLLEFY